MNGKKKLAGWQFGILLGLLVLMLSTMFMPLFNINGKVVDGTVKAINKSLGESLVDLMKTLKEELSPVLKEWVMDEIKKELEKEGLSMSDLSEEGYSESDIEKMVDESIDAALDEGFDIVAFLEDELNISIERSEKGYDNFIKFIEEEKKIRLTNISPFYIMTKSFNKFVGADGSKENDTEKDKKTAGKAADTSDKEDADNTTESAKEGESKAQDKSLEKVYNSIRIILIVIYVLCLVAFILTIVAFAASWSKTIPAAIDMICGIFATVMLIIIRGSVPKIFNGVLDVVKTLLGKEFVKLCHDEFYKGFFEGTASSNLEIPQNVSDAVNKVFSELKNFAVSDFSSSIVKFGFIIALIIAIIIVIFSLISIFVGGKELYVTRYMPDDDTSEGFYSDDYVGGEVKSENPFGDDTSGAGTIPIVTPDQTSIVTPPTNPAAQQQLFVQQSYAQQSFVQQQQPQIQTVLQTPQTVAGKVVCTKGVAYGQGFQLPVDRKVVVGKSPSKANLVINNQNVSNIHCSIRYNAARNTYIVKDHSTNGTFVNGVRIAKDVAMEYPAGTILSLADGTNQITLG